MNHKAILFFGLIFLNSLAAQTKPSITQLVDKYFDFTPCGATQEVINAKSKQKLLLKISHSPANLQAAVSAISRVKLCGINLEDYFKTSMRLASKGYYVGDIIKKILADPEFVFYLAAHVGYPFDQSLSVLYLSLLSDESRIIPLLEEQMKSDIPEKSQSAIVMALGFMVNKDAIKILTDPHGFKYLCEKPQNTRNGRFFLEDRRYRQITEGCLEDRRQVFDPIFGGFCCA